MYRFISLPQHDLFKYIYSDYQLIFFSELTEDLIIRNYNVCIILMNSFLEYLYAHNNTNI